MQNPHKDSKPSPKSPSSSPPPPPDTTQTVAGDVTAAEQGGGSSVGGVASSDIARIVQVVDPTPGGGGSPGLWGESGDGGGRSYAAAAASVEGGGLVVAEGGSSAVASTLLPEKQGNKQKRKSSQVSDPPPWPPKCNECGKEFPSWKAAFGHMRAHPERDYRGFFRPPTSSSPKQRVRLEENINTGVEQGGGDTGASSAEAGTGGVGFDLNQPTTEEVEASDTEARQRNQASLQSSSSSSAVRRSTDQDENKVGFDLNQLPPSEEDDHDQHKKP